MTVNPFTGSVRLRATGPVDAATAWARYRELDRWARWAPQITGVRASPRTLRKGLRGQVLGPLGVPVPFVVDAVDARRREWIWSVGVRPVVLRLHHGVEAHGTGSSTWLVVHGPWPVILAYAPFARLAMKHLVSDENI
jgi:hypothetical protein